MGNHNVGRAFAGAARAMATIKIMENIPRDQALKILDAIAEDYIGADAEFDDELNDDTPLRALVTIAFDATPEEISDRDNPPSDRDDLWYEGPITRFRARYQFC